MKLISAYERKYLAKDLCIFLNMPQGVCDK